MPRRVSRTYGFPFRGYMGSLSPHACPNDYATIGSYNYLYRSSDGSFVRRQGKTVVGGTAGLLEGAWGALSRRVAELVSPSLADGAPTHSALYTKDDITKGYLDDGRCGQLYFRSTGIGETPSAASNQVCGKSFSATHYPTSGLAHFQCVPLWYSSGEGGLTRMNTKLARRFHCPGSRNFLDVGGWRHFPSYWGTPSRWNRRFNDSDSTTENEQHFLSGPVPPLWCPTFTAETPQTESAGWKSGQRFFASVMFQNEDGSWSMPATPRPIVSAQVLSAGLGLYTVPGTYPVAGLGVQQYVPSVTWTIPIGPPGTTRRALLRSDSVQLGTSLVDPAADKLKIAAVIEDNTSTTYVDYLGDDVGLKDDPDHLYFRWDHIMPPPSRHIWDFDGRTAHGYGRTSRCAIFIAPTGITIAKDLNLPIDGVWGASTFFIHNDGTTLRLKYLSGGATTENEITLSGLTLQGLVDTINTTAVTSAGKEWRAQLAPGASGMTPAADLLTHSLTTSGTCAGTSAATFITSAAQFANIAVGARIKPDAGGKIPVGTYVKAVETASKLHLCDSAGAAVVVGSGGFSTTALTFYFDLGDTEPAAVGGHTATIGSQRVVGGSYYGCLYFKNSHFAKEPSGKSAVWMTVGGPLQVRQSANAFVSAASNKHVPPGNPGICMGGGGLADGSVVLFSNERHILRNTRGGRTGLDEDYRLDRVTRTGCISDASAVLGFGWVGYASSEGYMACDISNEINLTRNLWDAGSNYGEFGDEFKACILGATSDTDIARFSAMVVGNRLHLMYRGGTGLVAPNLRVVMDFGEGSQSSGLGQLLNPNGEPWGWSTPLWESISHLGWVRRAMGFQLYATSDSYKETTDGLIWEIEAGTYQEPDEPNHFISAQINTAVDFCESLQQKAANDVRVKFNGQYGSNDTISLDLIGYIQLGSRTASDYCPAPFYLIPSPPRFNDGKQSFTLQLIQFPRELRDKHHALQLVFGDTGVSNVPSGFFGAELTADILDDYGYD